MTIRLMHVMAGGAVGGAENIFLEDVLALADAPGIEQYIVTRREPHRMHMIKARKFHYRTASFSNWLPWRTKRRIQQAVEEFKPHIIQYWMGRAGQFAVTGDHVNVAWYGGYYNRLERFPLCTHHIVLTRDLKRHVLESGAAEQDVSIVHTMAAFPGEIHAISRAELDTPQDATVLLGLARLHWKKGWDILLNALVDLPNCYAWIAGDGPLKDDLQAMAQLLGVDNRVRFLGWRNDRERLIKACDIVAFPSRYEPFGTVMVDAWAMKKPLIAADAQGPAAYVKDGENGLLIPKNNIEVFVQAVRKLQNDPVLEQKIVAGGWETYQQHFTKDAFLRDSVAVYTKLVK